MVSPAENPSGGNGGGDGVEQKFLAPLIDADGAFKSGGTRDNQKFLIVMLRSNQASGT